jgi:hypothetical protein
MKLGPKIEYMYTSTAIRQRVLLKSSTNNETHAEEKRFQNMRFSPEQLVFVSPTES